MADTDPVAAAITGAAAAVRTAGANKAAAELGRVDRWDALIVGPAAGAAPATATGAITGKSTVAPGRLADDGCGAVGEIRGATATATAAAGAGESFVPIGAESAVDRRARGAAFCACEVSEPRAERVVDLGAVEPDARDGPAGRDADPLALELESLAGSALATVGTEAIATPTPSATASAPTRPT